MPVGEVIEGMDVVDPPLRRLRRGPPAATRRVRAAPAAREPVCRHAATMRPGPSRAPASSTTFSWDAQLAAMQASSLTGLDPEADPDLYRAVRDTKGITLYRVIQAMVGAGAFVGAIEDFGARSARRCASRRRSPRGAVREPLPRGPSRSGDAFRRRHGHCRRERALQVLPDADLAPVTARRQRGTLAISVTSRRPCELQTTMRMTEASCTSAESATPTNVPPSWYSISRV